MAFSLSSLFPPRRAVFAGVALMAAGAMVWTITQNPTLAQEGGSSGDLMEKLAPRPVAASPLTDAFKEHTSDFSLELFQALYDGGNTLTSPISLQMALGMTGNGAAGETAEEFRRLFGGELNQAEINDGNRQLLSLLQSGEENSLLKMANAIWLRSGFDVRSGFLQENANYYKADAYSADFGPSTVEEINAWVKENTDGLIPKMLDALSPQDRMVLLNTVLFDAKWARPYNADAVWVEPFTLADGSVVTTDFLHSKESRYLSGAGATGFIKDYSGGKYSFVALLPDSGSDMNSFVKSLDGAAFRSLLDSATREMVTVSMPKFSFDWEKELSPILKEMGLTTAFDPQKADFSAISTDGDLSISQVLQKTFIQVDELGTKAGAASSATISVTSAPIQPDKSVILDRPFVFAIIENETSLPLFLGVLENPTA